MSVSSKRCSRRRRRKNKNASEMRQKCAKMGLVLLGKEERSKMRQKYIKNASKMCGKLLGENTFWTSLIMVIKFKVPLIGTKISPN